MKDVLAFAAAALPWVVMGICVAVLLVNRKKLSNTLHGSLGLGMSLGMLVGLAIGQAVKKKT